MLAPGGSAPIVGAMIRLLLLSGSGDARALAGRLDGLSGVRATLSFVTPPRLAHPPDMPVRLGGFGGADGFRRYIASAGISAVIDATHPFAAAMASRTAALCQEAGLPHLKLLRPAWQPGPGDCWQPVDDAAAAAAAIPAGAIVFVASGRQTLSALADVDARLICRRIDPPDEDFPFDNGYFLQGSPPFSVAAETALFRELSITYLLVKNAGGSASRAKLEAARELGLPVIMIRRPPPPDCRIVPTVDAALDWVRAL